MQEEVRDFRERGFCYCIPSLYVYISVVLLFYSHKMKRTLFATAIAIAMLGSSISFAQSPLAEQFTTLSEQIIEQSARPFDKLEELQTLFKSCAEKNTEIWSACAEWLSNSYHHLKERAEKPYQIYVELWSGDVQIRKIGEKKYFDGYSRDGQSSYLSWDLYEVRIPKYWFILQIPIRKGESSAKRLKQWTWNKSGMIVVPFVNIDKDFWIAEQFALFSTPQLTGWTSLVEVSEQYRKVFEEVFFMKDLKNFIKWDRDQTRKSEGVLTYTQEEFGTRIFHDSILEWGLPSFKFNDSEEEFYGLWWFRWLDSFCENQKHHHSNALKNWRKVNPDCYSRQKEKRGSDYLWTQINWGGGTVFWNKNTPKVMRFRMQIFESKENELISK